MKNILSILKDFGLELAEDKQKEFEKEVLKNYKTTAEVDGIKEQLEEAKTSLKNRDADLDNFKKQLEEAGEDKAKLEEATKKIAELQSQYDKAQEESANKLKAKEYEFAIDKKISDLKFTSKAARTTFKNDLIKKDLKFENGELLGFDDYVKDYKANDEGVFASDGDGGKPSFSTGLKGGQGGDGKKGDSTLPLII